MIIHKVHTTYVVDTSAIILLAILLLAIKCLYVAIYCTFFGTYSIFLLNVYLNISFQMSISTKISWCSCLMIVGKVCNLGLGNHKTFLLYSVLQGVTAWPQMYVYICHQLFATKCVVLCGVMSEFDSYLV